MLGGSWPVTATANVTCTLSFGSLKCGHLYRPRFRKQQLSRPLRSQCLTPASTKSSESSTTACLQTAAALPPVTCTYDVIALGNLCLDIFVSVPELPSTELKSRQKLLSDLTAAPPSRTAWEVGGNTNFMIAAARLGMQVAPVGHLGPDEYGQYIKDVLQVICLANLLHCESLTSAARCILSACEVVQMLMQKEGVHEVRPLVGLEHLDESLKQTLLCFVLVAPDAAHSFCSRYDFGPWPLLPGVTSLPEDAWQVRLSLAYECCHTFDGHVV